MDQNKLNKLNSDISTLQTDIEYITNGGNLRPQYQIQIWHDLETVLLNFRSILQELTLQ
jgi:hypothetical protein